MTKVPKAAMRLVMIAIGNGLRNVFHGLLGDDTLRGEGGDNLLVGEAGSDVGNGGAGTDIAKRRDASTVPDLSPPRLCTVPWARPEVVSSRLFP
jgi:hypothetical protein